MRDSEINIHGMWSGQDCYLVAGGSSLEGFDWERLRGLNVIAINKSLETLPFAQILYWSDCRFYDQNKHAILSHSAPHKITKCHRAKEECITYFVPTGTHGLEKKPGYLREGRNSGYAAMNVAYHMGVKRMILLGYDMHGPHWHEGYDSILIGDAKFHKWVRTFEHLVQPLVENQIEVINASIHSSLPYWPKVEIDEVIPQDITDEFTD